MLENPQKERRLLELLKKFKPSSTNRVLVFALYKKEAARVEQMLKGQGYECAADVLRLTRPIPTPVPTPAIPPHV